MFGPGGGKPMWYSFSLGDGVRLGAFVRVLAFRNDLASSPGLSGVIYREWVMGCVFGPPVSRQQAALGGSRAHGCVGRAWRAKELGEKVGKCLFGRWVLFSD